MRACSNVPQIQALDQVVQTSCVSPSLALPPSLLVFVLVNVLLLRGVEVKASGMDTSSEDVPLFRSNEQDKMGGWNNSVVNQSSTDARCR